MNQDLFMHGLGLLSLTVIGGAAALSMSTIVDALDRNWSRIAAALRGETGLPPASPQPFRTRARQVAVVICDSTKMQDAA
ncbi:hypothetical protein ACWGNZ_14835 [Sphingomonas zeae]